MAWAASTRLRAYFVRARRAGVGRRPVRWFTDVLVLFPLLRRHHASCLRGAALAHMAALASLALAGSRHDLVALVAATGLALSLLSFLARGSAGASRLAEMEPPSLKAAPAGAVALASAAAFPAGPAQAGLRRPALAPGRPAERRALALAAHGRAWADLMSRVSHELRTPLNAVLGFSDIMTRELFGPLGSARYLDYARHIHDSGRELLKSAEDTLALTAILADTRRTRGGEAVDLAALALDAWSFFSGTASARGLWLDLRVAEELEVLADRRALRQVLINLFSEAIARSRGPACIGLAAYTDAGLVQIEVRSEPGVPRPLESLPVCIARALLELQGSSLIEFGDGDGWRALTVLEAVAQKDFFAPAVAGERRHCQPQRVAA